MSNKVMDRQEIKNDLNEVSLLSHPRSARLVREFNAMKGTCFRPGQLSVSPVVSTYALLGSPTDA